MVFRVQKRMAGLGLLAVLTVAASAQWMPLDTGTPAFHNAPPGKVAPPPLLAGDDLKGEYFTHHYQVTAYQMAAAVSNEIYQMPCFCWCSRAMGHKSLHSCFEGTHGAVCSVCMREAAYVYQQTHAGQTPQQIRAGIVNGNWKTVDLPAIHLE